MQKALGKRFSTIKIIKVFRQVVSGTNFQFQIEVRYSTSVVVRYVIVVYQNLNKVYEITSQEFVNVPEFNFGNLKRVPNLRDIPLLADIQAAFRRDFASQAAELTDILEAEVSEPYYVFLFATKSNRRFKVAVSYDVIRDKIDLLGTK